MAIRTLEARLIKAFPDSQVITWTNSTGSNVVEGEVIDVRGRAGVALIDIANGSTGSIYREGLFRAQKTASLAIGQFDRVYWDAANSKATTTETAIYMGRAAVASASSATTVDVILGDDGHMVECLSTGVLDHASFTDGGAAIGSIDSGVDLPADALVLGRTVRVTEGFAGDTTAVIEVGDGTDHDRFGPATDESVLAIAELGSNEIQGNNFCAAATSVHVRVTGGADWGSITAGKVEVEIFYIRTNP